MVSVDQKPAAQRFSNGEVHDWYRILLGFSDHFVADLIHRFNLGPEDLVLDPFCGSGTTLVECMKRSVPVIGIDANPSSCFASRVKTDWSPRSSTLLRLLTQVRQAYARAFSRSVREDPTYRYLESSGMLERGWISEKPLKKALALKRAIQSIKMPKAYRDALTLALISEVVSSASNIRFGPEPYCGLRRKDANLLEAFSNRVENMARDLTIVRGKTSAIAEIYQGDSRNCLEVLGSRFLGVFSAIICSPPYPAEHDYTRHSRLELCFLEAVEDVETLQSIKRAMIRSHTKGIYKGDNDIAYLDASHTVKSIVRRISSRAANKRHGFARLYSKVVEEYFGGMKRHLASLYPLLTPGANCAYVVGDQSCYLRVHIPTARVLSEIASDVGFVDAHIEQWRVRRSTVTSRLIDENILFFRKPVS